MKILLTILLLSLLAMSCIAQSIDATGNPKRAEWMSKGTFGMMTHFLINPDVNEADATNIKTTAEGDKVLIPLYVGETPNDPRKTANFNKIIDNFDIKLYMKQFEQTRADWLIFTIVQNTGYWNSSNKVVDSVLPGRTPKRDLVLEIAKAVKARGKHFIVYIPGNIFYINDGSGFYNTWEKILRDYSLKLGKNCDGWWVDGCDPAVLNGETGDNWARAMRAGNPNSAIAMSMGPYIDGNLKNLSKVNDYFPGEVHFVEDGFIRKDPMFNDIFLDKNGRVRVKYQAPQFFVPKEKIIDGTLLHALVPLDLTFNPGILEEWVQFPTNDMIKLAHSFSDVGGGVTFNVPVTKTGKIPTESLNKLIAIGKSYVNKTKKYPLDMTVLDRTKEVNLIGENPNPANKAFGKPSKLLSLDGKTEAGPSAWSAFAWKGNDGNDETYAAAAYNWAWTYFVDLESSINISKITLRFDNNGWSTDFAINLSSDGKTWTTFKRVDNSTNEKFFSFDLNENARYVAVQSFKADNENQTGYQMRVSELQVF